MTSLILRITIRRLLPMLLLFSVFLLARGHHEPGGGFGGGLVAACVFVLYTLVFGDTESRRAWSLGFRGLIGGGLLLALASGSLSVAYGRPWMTSVWISPRVPLVGRVELGTPLVFDLGVYLVVLGVTLSILLPLAEET